MESAPLNLLCPACHTPLPAVANCVTGPIKLLSPTVTVTWISDPVVLITLSEEVLRISIVALLVSLLTFAGVVVAFVWAARKDGEEDRAVQARLGIRRRTRLGR